MGKGNENNVHQLSLESEGQVSPYPGHPASSPSSTPVTMEAKLSSSRIMSAACLDTSEPAMPMAMPMSAFFSAGESFTPSPVTATMAPCAEGTARAGGAAPAHARPWPCPSPHAHLPLAALHDDELLLGRRPGKDDLRVILEDLVQLLRRHVLQVRAVHHTRLGFSGGRAEPTDALEPLLLLQGLPLSFGPPLLLEPNALPFPLLS